MLLSLVIVAVEITSFTVACFSLVALLCFFSSIKKSQQKKTLDKEGDKISLCPPTFNCTWGGSLPHPPHPTSLLFVFSPHTEVGEQGRLSFCKNVEIRCLHNLCGPSRRKLNQESIVFRDCFSRKNNNLVPYVINHLIPPLVLSAFPHLSAYFSSVLFSHLYLPLHPFPTAPQVLLESALKHWSRVKRYVAQDGSG